VNTSHVGPFPQRMWSTALVLITATMIGSSPTAHADDAGAFQSPSGNIDCLIGTLDEASDANFVYCEIRGRPSWVEPPRPPDCPLAWGSRFALKRGKAAEFACYHQQLPAPEQALGYGQQRSVGTIDCDSEPSGMTCIDTSTGHFFRVSRESYQLG
jgi:hypothetical protein